jgi:hypothetical protein
MGPGLSLNSRFSWVARRLHSSAVAWSWAFNGLRIASGLILLPLVLHELPGADLGMYYVLLSLAAMVPLIDFGFGPTIGRFVGYAMGGADSLQAYGVAAQGLSRSPNYELVWQLLFTTRKLYRYLTLLVFVVLGAWGTYMVELRIVETSSVLVTRCAWVVTLCAALLDIYANWWGTFLRSMNQVVSAARIGVASGILKLLLGAGLLLSGFGLLSLPLASLAGSTVGRWLSRRACLALLSDRPAPATVDIREHLRTLWPNTWRLGLQFFTGYLTVNANMAICVHLFGLNMNGVYGFSNQLVDIAAGMAAVWTAVKWPVIGQYRARHELPAIRQLLWSRIWLQNLTFLALAAGIIILAPALLWYLGSSKSLLPEPWLALLVLNGFLLMQFNLWGTLISIENRLPYLWPTVATNVLSLGLSLALVYSNAGIGGLVLGPLLAGILFNYWYWPPFAARGLGTTFLGFLLRKPQPSQG